MEKTEMMKQFEHETGKHAGISRFPVGGYALDAMVFPTLGTFNYGLEYVSWLEAQLTWRPASEKPDKGKEVILSYVDCYGHRINVLGSYVRRFDEETDSADDEDVMEYSDEKDEYYLKEGWYEHTTHSDYDHWLLHEKIDKWLPIPPQGE